MIQHDIFGRSSVKMRVRDMVTVRGITPHIGENGHWFIGNEDTGIPARGDPLTFEDLTPEQIDALRGEPGANYTLPTATAETLGGIKVGEDLQIEDGVLSVVKATNVEQDNTHPITAAAVYTELGNVEALLRLI